MTVKELRDALSKFPDDMEVLTRKTELGNVGCINNVKEDRYTWLFEENVPCVLLTDESEG